MKKISLLIVSLFVIFSVNISADQIQDAFDDGYSEGYSDAEMDIDQELGLINIDQLESELENAYKDGYSEGQQDRESELETEIENSQKSSYDEGYDEGYEDSKSYYYDSDSRTENQESSNINNEDSIWSHLDDIFTYSSFLLVILICVFAFLGARKRGKIKKISDDFQNEIKILEDRNKDLLNKCNILENDVVNGQKSNMLYQKFLNSLYIDYSKDLSKANKSRKEDMKIENLFFENNELYVNIKGSTGNQYKTNLVSCTCKDFQFRKSPCKHMIKLTALLQNEKELVKKLE